MTKFTMNAKELKTMMDKGVAAIDKKSTLHSLKCLYFSIVNLLSIVSPLYFAERTVVSCA